MNGSVRIKRMFKNRIIWNNNMQIEERSTGVKQITENTYGGIMVSAFWGAALPTDPAVCNKHDSFCYIQSSLSKGYLCGHAIETTYSSVTSSTGKSK